MAKRNIHEPIAMRLYAEGMTLEEISDEVPVSVTSLSKWKTSTTNPGTGIDEWDRARQQKQSNMQRLKDLFERELIHVEGQPAGSISAASMDALSKLGSLVKSWEAVIRSEKASNQPVIAEVDKPALFLENLQFIAEQLKIADPEGLKILGRNFDLLTEQFKAEHAQEA